MTIQFDDGAADALIGAAKSAAETLRSQAAPRRAVAEDAATDFAGAYARSFTTVCAAESNDRGRLASELVSLVTQVEDAKRRAQAEKDRIAAHNAWQDREDSRDRKRRAAGALGAPPIAAGISDPEPSNEPNPAPTVSADFAPASRDRGAAGGSGGVSSAVPERLDRFAAGTAAANRDLRDRESRLSGAWAGFTGACSWVNIGSATFITGFTRLNSESDLDAEWAKTLAASFAKAGGGTMENAALDRSWAEVVSEKVQVKCDETPVSPSELELLLRSLSSSARSTVAPDTTQALAAAQSATNLAANHVDLATRLAAYQRTGELKIQTKNRHVDTSRYSPVAQALKSGRKGNWSARPGMEDAHAKALHIGKLAGRANAVAGFAFEGAAQWKRDSKSDFTAGERVGRTATRSVIVGGAAWAGAAGGAQLGAMGGMFLGPGGAVVGAVLGGIVGGLLATGVGNYVADKVVDFGGKVGQGAVDVAKNVSQGVADVKQAATLKAAKVAGSVRDGLGNLGDALSFWGKKA